MANPQTPSLTPDAAKGDEIPLEDIDKLLEAEDPGFSKSLDEVRAVEADKNVVIEASVPEDTLPSDDLGVEVEQKQNLARRLSSKLRGMLAVLRARLKERLRTLGKDTLVFLKTRPKEYALYSVVLLKALVKNAAAPVVAFKNADSLSKVLVLLLVVMAVVSAWIIKANFKGIWLPAITEPILRSFEPGADWVEVYDPKQPGESFYSAFPQERFEFLFKKMKVNLKRTTENPNPMGAFEMLVLLDSKDAAIEVRDREVEFHDLLQRVMEEETFAGLEAKEGKVQVKARLKRELNQKLTQGWVKDISFKTFVLKP